MSTTQFELTLPTGGRAVVGLSVTVDGDLGHDAERINRRLAQVLKDHWSDIEGVQVRQLPTPAGSAVGG